MKKLIVLTLMATAFLATAGNAQAGNSHRGQHYYPNHGYSPAKHYRKHARQERRHYKQHRYGRSYGRHDYGYRHHGHGDAWKIAAGAAVLGTIIYAANSRPSRTVYRTRTVRANDDHWYRVDTDGQCVEVRLNQKGQEVWTYVDSSYCY